jgi:hypothetical protein
MSRPYVAPRGSSWIDPHAEERWGWTSKPDPATITPRSLDLYGAGGRAREDVRNAVVFRARAAECSAAAVAAIEAMHADAERRWKAGQRAAFVAGIRRPLTWFAPLMGGRHEAS